MTSSPPPLQLENAFYDLVHVDAHADYSPGPDDQVGEVPVRIDLRTAQLKDEPDLWNLVMDVSIARDGDTVPPYDIRVRCWSVFRLAPNLDGDKAAQLTRVTGGSIVYSGMREFIGMLTSRGPWGGFFLPTISLLGTEPTAVEPPVVNQDADVQTGSRDKAATAPKKTSKKRPPKVN